MVHLRLETDHPCLSVGVCDLEGRALRAVVDQVVGEVPGRLVTVCGKHLFDLGPRLGRLRYTRPVRRVRDEAWRVVVHVVQHDGQLGWRDRDGLALMSVLHSERLLSIITICRWVYYYHYSLPCFACMHRSRASDIICGGACRVASGVQNSILVITTERKW